MLKRRKKSHRHGVARQTLHRSDPSLLPLRVLLGRVLLEA